MKCMKRILSVLLVVLLFCSLSCSALAVGAERVYRFPRDTQFRYDPGLDGMFYDVDMQEIGIRDISWKHLAENLYSPTTDSVEKNVSRTMSFTGSLSGSAEVDALLANAEVAAEVSFGYSKTSSVTRTYSIPPYSAYWCYYGSLMTETSGNMETWVKGKRTAVRSVFAEYSYDEFSSKEPA